jgi:TonB-linked SusC/RagA family outer membrane protein
MKRHLLFLKNSLYYKAALALVLTVFIFSSSFAQGRRVSGTVTDNSGPAPGVTIRVKGASAATSSDNDGRYSITVPDNATLVFTYLGYTTQEIPVGTRTTLNVVLSADSRDLEQVVVVGYGTTQRKDLTGSVGSVSAAQLEKTPVTTLDQAIQGRVSGVQITNNDGAPGSGTQVQIRGIGTFGSNDPLYVVDGYPVTTGLGSINQNDIATIDILKDASATAIYGNRAANGVVIITTKRGRQDGGVQISLDAMGSIQSKPKMYDVLNAQQFAALAVERAIPDNFAALPEWSNPASLRTIDWQEEAYQSGYRQNYNLAIRGGNEKVQSAFSAGWFDQKGIVIGSKYTRLNTGLNVDYKPFAWLKSSTSLKYSRSDNKVGLGTGGQNAGIGIGTLSKLVPTITGNPLTDQAKDENGNYGFYTANNQFVNYLTNPIYFVETP